MKSIAMTLEVSWDKSASLYKILVFYCACLISLKLKWPLIRMHVLVNTIVLFELEMKSEIEAFRSSTQTCGNNVYTYMHIYIYSYIYNTYVRI